MESTITSNKKDLADFAKWYKMKILLYTWALGTPIENMIEMYYEERKKQQNNGK